MRKTDNITKRLRHPSAGVALCALALAGALSVTGCQKQGIPAQKGDGILFSAGISGSESGTKTAYAGHTAGSESENINWLSGDQIRIWSAECSEPTDHYADYTVTPESTATSAKIAVNPGTVGLKWGEPETTHHFYAVYPSPNTTDKGSDAGTLNESDPKFTFTGHIPSTQKISGNLTTQQTTENSKTITTTVAAPNMTNLYMVAKTEATPEDAGSGVFLNFRPLSTAIQFTIQNDMSAGNMCVESVKIMSDPKTGSGTTAKNLSGAFVADLATAWTKPDDITAPTGSGIIGSYNNLYPPCTEPSDKSGQTSAVLIDFKNTTAYTTGIAKGNRLQFTFFLLPTQSVDDLSFVIKRADGVILKTRLEMADGTGIPFPVHKKTYVKGILVPDGRNIIFSVTQIDDWTDGQSEDVEIKEGIGPDPDWVDMGMVSKDGIAYFTEDNTKR